MKNVSRREVGRISGRRQQQKIPYTGIQPIEVANPIGMSTTCDMQYYEIQ